VQVLEETGCDVSKLLKLDDHIEVLIGQQRVRLYIIAGVKEDTVFAPQTKKEISVCKFSKSFLIFLWLCFFCTYQENFK
jgi:mRNA-decapping enzyme subunit 2